MFNDLANKGFRAAFLAENIKAGLAFQIRALRERAKLSQPELAEKAGKTQSVISRLENPNYGKYTIRTLLDLARAFDVALLIKFVPYGRLLSELKDLTPEALAVDSYTQERDKQLQSETNALSKYYGTVFVSGKLKSDLRDIQLKPIYGNLSSVIQDQSNETTDDKSSASDMAVSTLRSKPEGQGIREVWVT